MKPRRITYPQGGWEYNYPGIGYVRRFDNGSKVYFFNVNWNGYHNRSYTVFVDSPSEPVRLSTYRLSIKIHFKNDVYEEISIWARTRKELFVKTREDIKKLRRALRVIPF